MSLTIPKGGHYKDYYTMVNVNGSMKKLRVQWDDKEKGWRQGGYIDESATFNSKSQETYLKPGDKIQFVYDVANPDGTPKGDYGQEAWGPVMTYDPSTYTMNTQVINVKGSDVLFPGTVTDTYGKTYTTPYFKMEPETKTMSAQDVSTGDFVIEKKDGSVKEDWELDDVSFLTYSYDAATNSYSSYSVETDAYNYVLADMGEITHYNENKKFGFRYDPAKKLFYVVDAQGVITARGFSAEELASIAAKTGLDYSRFLSVLEHIMNMSESGDSAQDQSEMLGNLYQELDILLYNLAGGGYVDEKDGEDYEMFRILVEIGAFGENDDDDDSSYEAYAYIDEDPDYDADTWGSDDSEGGSDDSDDSGESDESDESDDPDDPEDE